MISRILVWILSIVTVITVVAVLPQSPLPALIAAAWAGLGWYHLSRVQPSPPPLPVQHHDSIPQQVERRVVQLSTLNKVLALLTETLSPDNVLDTVISSASAISDATAVSVYLLRDGSFQLVRNAGMSDAFTAESPRPLLNPVEQLDQPIVIENVHSYTQATHLRELMACEKKSAWVELPLWVAGRGIGAVTLYFDQPQTFSHEDIELLRTFANQAAQAIQNAHLYAGTYAALETRIEQLSALATIGREIIATMDLQTISNLILKHAMEATRATSGVIVLFNEKRDGLILCAQHGYPDGTFTGVDSLNQGITGRALQTGSIVLVDDVRKEPDYLSLVNNTCSQLSVPVIWRGEVIGVITLESDQHAGFQAEDGHFVSQLTNQMVIAVDNARLFQRVAEARDRMQAILDTMAEGIVLIDRWGQIALANPRVDLIDLNSDNLLGSHINELLTRPETKLTERMGYSSETDLRAILGTASAEESVSYSLTRDDGKTVYIYRQNIPVRDEDGMVIGVLMVFQDETEQRELERARESFSNMIVHDLRSPLTAVTSGLSFLTEVIPSDNEFADMVNKTANTSQRAIRKMLNRVNSLLDISRMQSGQLSLSVEAITLDKVVDTVFAELNPLANDLKVSLTLQDNGQFPPLNVDAEKLERVMLNLVDNALKFSPRGSTIIVRAGVLDSYARIEVIDSGPGVPEALRQHIFDSFAQIREQRGIRRGSGLGLAFCKLAIEAHGGRIWVEDNPNGGSIFVFTLPILIT
jgi:two-component system, NtrC family, sensor histidine kinase KinB